MNTRLDKVLKAVKAELGVSRAQILAPTRSSRDVAWARQVAMWLYVQTGNGNYSEAGRAFNRDRTTVRHAVVKCNYGILPDVAERLLNYVHPTTTV